MSPIGLFFALFVGYAVWLYFEYTALAYLFGVIAFAGLTTLLYFDWGYHETDPAALGSYTGNIISYFVVSAALCIYAFYNLSTLVGLSCIVICTLFGVFLVVPIIQFFQANH